MAPIYRPDADGDALLYVGRNADGSAITLCDAVGIRILSLETKSVVFSADIGGLR